MGNLLLIALAILCPPVGVPLLVGGFILLALAND